MGLEELGSRVPAWRRPRGSNLLATPLGHTRWKYGIFSKLLQILLHFYRGGPQFTASPGACRKNLIPYQFRLVIVSSIMSSQPVLAPIASLHGKMALVTAQVEELAVVALLSLPDVAAKLWSTTRRADKLQMTQ